MEGSLLSNFYKIKAVLEKDKQQSAKDKKKQKTDFYF